MQTADGWRINKLPNGVFLDWQQFQATYKRATLYFVDPTGKTVVPDPRYLAVSDPDQLATELVSKLIGGPRPEMAKTVRNLLGPPLKMIGPVTRADGGKTGIGRGYGGARVELENLTTTDPHSRQLLRRRSSGPWPAPTSRAPTSSTPTVPPSTTGSPRAGTPPTWRPPIRARWTAPRPVCTRCSAAPWCRWTVSGRPRCPDRSARWGTRRPRRCRAPAVTSPRW